MFACKDIFAKPSIVALRLLYHNYVEKARYCRELLMVSIMISHTFPGKQLVFPDCTSFIHEKFKFPAYFVYNFLLYLSWFPFALAAFWTSIFNVSYVSNIQHIANAPMRQAMYNSIKARYTVFMKIKENPDAEIVRTIREGLKKTGGYCPCRLQRTEENKCMCKEFRDQIKDPNFEGFCHCMLYYKSKD